MNVSPIRPPVFSGYRKANNPEIAAMIGQQAMLVTHNRAMTVPKGYEFLKLPHLFEPVTVVSARGHQGVSINGIKVTNAVKGTDFVDRVTLRRRDGSREEMLYGKFEGKDGFNHTVNTGPSDDPPPVIRKGRDLPIYETRGLQTLDQIALGLNVQQNPGHFPEK